MSWHLAQEGQGHTGAHMRFLQARSAQSNALYWESSIYSLKHSREGMTIQTTKPGTLTMREALYYTLSKPVSTVIIGCDTIARLEENVHLAREFTPLSEGQSTELVAKAEPAAKPSLFFRFYDRP